MLAASFKRTKIVATIGPASREPQVLESLLEAGVNAFRLNLSHGSHEEHARIVHHARALTKKHGKPVAVIADLQGPKIRVGSLPADGVPFVRDQTIRFEIGADYEASGIIPLQYDVSVHVKKGERIFLRDGMIQVEILSVHKSLITSKVLAPGILTSNQGMNLPDTDLGGDILTRKDIADIRFAVENDADYIALSFVQTADDIIRLKDRLAELKSDMKVIAKIETAAAIKNLDAIVQATDVIMVARGDLAVETAPETVPAVQRRLIELCKQFHKTVIVATQMLESMTQAPQPTRAEVSDVATAVLEGADAVMLSGETAMGLFPVDTVRMMKRIILYTEREELPKLPDRRYDTLNSSATNAIAQAAVVLAAQLPAKLIFAETSSGNTARNIASLRPKVPIVIVTHEPRVFQQMAMVWGGKSFLAGSMHDATDQVVAKLRTAGNIVPGDAIIVASGNQPGVAGGTDRVRIQLV